jgi:hypothetical protein
MPPATARGIQPEPLESSRRYRHPASGIQPLESLPLYPSAARSWFGPGTRRVLTGVVTALLAPTLAAVLADLIYGWIHP